MGTQTRTETITHARYVAAKIAADLKRLQRLAGRNIPLDSDILDFQAEAERLLYDGYLGTVTYGFRRSGEWVLALQYSATSTGHLSDNDPGGIDVYRDVTGAGFSSYLTYSDKWWHELDSEEARLHYKRESLPFVRSAGTEPNGRWDDYDNNYRSGDISVRRRTTS